VEDGSAQRVIIMVREDRPNGVAGKRGDGGVGVGDDRHLPEVSLYCDGACKGNPGKGGYAAILRIGKQERVLTGAVEHTTNNRMELTAAIKGLESLQDRHRVHLVTDSEYLRKGITEWMDSWIRRGWKTAAGKRVLNRDLWERVDVLRKKHTLTVEWVEAHAGHEFNERCDQLANQAIRNLPRGIG
jgi:ribonuclease HI